VLQSYASGSGGKFVQDIQDQQGIAYGVSLKYEPQIRGGSITACASTTAGNEDAVLKAIQEEVQQIVTGPITYRDYRSAVNAAVGNYWINRQIRFSQIIAIVQNVLAGKGVDGYQDIPTQLQGVKQEDLHDVAQRVFRMEKAVIVRLHGQPSLDPSPAN
jgi:predicted Zn-dependent peptidase